MEWGESRAEGKGGEAIPSSKGRGRSLCFCLQLMGQEIKTKAHNDIIKAISRDTKIAMKIY